MNRHTSNRRGIAMLIVLWVIMVLSLLIGGFAFTMHVETQVASFSRKELKAQMLARSGIEIARMQLLLDLQSATKGGYDARNQAWATNDLYFDHPLGEGTYTVNVTDEESKMPINLASHDQLAKLLDLLGIDPSDSDVIVDSVADWIDDDDLHLLNGAESDYYTSLSPPYRAKNAALDRVEELLMIRGVTPEIYYGLPADQKAREDARPGLKDLVTANAAPQVNVNTTSPLVLEAWLGLDEAQVQAVVNRRDGADGIASTDDDRPFQTIDDFVGFLGGIAQQQAGQLRQIATVRSSFFTVTSTGNSGGVQRTIVATLRRDGANITVVAWREQRGGGA